MTLTDKNRSFFLKISRVWQNFSDYDFFKEINLSPEQIRIVEHEEEQMLIEGYPGTGKSITLIYKFINTLIKESEKRKILYVSYNSTLIEDTKKRLNVSSVYLDNKEKHDIDILTFHGVASKLLNASMINKNTIRKLDANKIEEMRDTQIFRIGALLRRFEEGEGAKISKEEKLYKTHRERFLTDEFVWMKANGIIKEKDYCNSNMIRKGRSNAIRLTVTQRNTVYKIFKRYEHDKRVKYRNSLDLEDYALEILKNIDVINEELKYDYIFVDEMQDLDPMQIKALCMLTKRSIVFSGDPKQRIYKKSPVNYEALGLNINEKGRRKMLTENYRSTLQIVKLANSLKFQEEKNLQTYNEKLFKKNGDKPIIAMYKDDITVIEQISKIIKSLFLKNPNKTVAIIHREEVMKQTGSKSNFRLNLEGKLALPMSDINNYYKRFNHTGERQIFYTNLYDVKGLEFDYVFILDFNNRYYPFIDEINKIKALEVDNKLNELIKQDIDEFKIEEKKRLYVAMTRAKEKLFIIGNKVKHVTQFSEFICDFNVDDFETIGCTNEDIKKAQIFIKEHVK